MIGVLQCSSNGPYTLPLTHHQLSHPPTHDNFASPASLIGSPVSEGIQENAKQKIHGVSETYEHAIFA